MLHFRAFARDRRISACPLLIGRRIQKARDAKHISQEDLAGAAQLSTVSISNIENGSSGVGSYNLFRIAEALDVSIVYLLYGEPHDMDDRLLETFLKAEKLDQTKKNLICNVISHLIDELNDLK